MQKHTRRRTSAPGANNQKMAICAPLLVFALVCGAADGQKRPRPAVGDGPDSHLDIRPDGSYAFEYDTRDATRHRHTAKAGSGGSPVAGEYREIDTAAPHRDRVTQYTAGANGFRVKGAHIARRMSLSQVPIPYSPPVRPDSPNYQPSYSGYRDPNNDPSYAFGFKTSQQARREQSDNRGTVHGQYEYRDDVGELHRVQYTAGKDTGFIVHNEVPDGRERIGPLFAQAPSRPGQRARGRSAVRVRPDGSFDFTAAGPNMRHQEVSNAQGFRRGSYTYVDDRGVQRTVEYEAGPNIGFKIINSHKGPSAFPHVPPTYYPGPIYPSKGTTPRPGDDDLFGFSEGFNTAESGPSVKPPKKPGPPSSDESIENTSFGDDGLWGGGGGGGGGGSGGLGSDTSGGSGGGGGKKPSYGGSSDGSSGGGGGSGGSNSNEDDFLVHLGENHDMYGPRPTGGYGSGGDSSPDSKPGGGFSKPEDASGGSSSAGSLDEDSYFGKPGGKPTHGGGGGTVPPLHHGGSYDADDIFGPTPPPFSRPSSSGSDESAVSGGVSVVGGASSGGSSAGDFLSGAAAGDRPALGGSGGGGSVGLPGVPGSGSTGGGFKVPYKKCCKSRRRNRKPGETVTVGGNKGATRRDGLVRLPPVRAHVQNIDVVPYGRRLPSPGEALERLGPDPRHHH